MNLAVEKAKQAIGSLYKVKTLRALNKNSKKSKNLVEVLSMYPNKGENFKVWEKSWPADRFIRVSHVELRGSNDGDVWGYLYNNGLRSTLKPIKIANARNRSVWNHEVGPSEVTLDNGVTYDEKDFAKFKALKFPVSKTMD